ncbi:hypothetical protein H6P81_015214 [Aristolochia fimbriata]|uniref:Uncharacterized protein n=1 Tax=Aristolochia fimbriata TaxID=158543 RepID=A0AAV7E6R9_ARIFI|nr:hypothetical protein H6P81_015214 [Aristolochia fimbriata]
MTWAQHRLIGWWSEYWSTDQLPETWSPPKLHGVSGSCYGPACCLDWSGISKESHVGDPENNANINWSHLCTAKFEGTHVSFHSCGSHNEDMHVKKTDQEENLFDCMDIQEPQDQAGEQINSNVVSFPRQEPNFLEGEYIVLLIHDEALGSQSRSNYSWIRTIKKRRQMKDEWKDVHVQMGYACLNLVGSPTSLWLSYVRAHPLFNKI